MNKLKVFFIIIVIFIAIGGTIGGIYIYIDDKERQSVLNEISYLNSLINAEEIDNDKINETLNRQVSSGEYSNVEKVAKSYLTETIEDLNKIVELLGDEQMAQLLTTDNYKEDGPEFEESFEYISNYKTEFTTVSNDFLDHISQENIEAYISSQNSLTDNEKEFLKELLIDDNIEDSYVTVLESIEMVKQLLDIEENVFNFLKENSNDWNVKNDELVFTSDELLEEFNNLISDI